MQLLPATTITAAITGVVLGSFDFRLNSERAAPRNLTLQAKFTYGSGGTTAKFWVQTSIDGGVTWIDIASFTFTTATGTKVVNLTSLLSVASFAPQDGALADDTVKDGLVGPLLRVKGTTTGTYGGGTTIRIDAEGHAN